MRVEVTEACYGPEVWYVVAVDGMVYHSMRLWNGPRLTLSQMVDMQELYRESLEG